MVHAQNLYVQMKFLHQFLLTSNSGTAQLKKTWFQAHIVEQLKSYPMVVESRESVQGNQNVPPSAWGTFCECLGVACIKPIAMELMDVSGL